jgi:alpha-tubulin suppressor-like RCC1 family protein
LNDVGQTGDKTLPRMVGPTPVPAIGDARDLDAGGSHTCALLADGSARCWGGGAYGQLGAPPIDAGIATVTVPGGGQWKQLAAGLRHTCALSDGGEIYCWGRTGEGQLGDGTVLQLTAPQAPVVGARDLVAIAAGGEHTCALTGAGAVSCWGRGDFGQLASNDTAGSSTPLTVALPPAAQLASGGEFSCARLLDGTVSCWGRGNRGQIGDGFTMDRRKPTLVGLPEKAVHIAAGLEHACAATAMGNVYCWGEAAGGRLGNAVMASSAQSKPILVQAGAAAGQLVAVGIGNAHGCALTRARQVICWGMSNYGQAGVAPPPPPAAATAVPPTVVAGLPDVAALAIGGDHSCVVTSPGAVWCWGHGDSGQLGFGTSAGMPQPVAILNFGPVTAAAAGSNHTCAVVKGAGSCWGANRFGQLGIGNTTNKGTPQAVMTLPGVMAIEGGDRHSCAVLTDGSARCWGSNQYGQLGTGAPLEQIMPVKVALKCE